MRWAPLLSLLPSPDARREAEKASFLTVAKVKKKTKQNKNNKQSILNCFLSTHKQKEKNDLPLLVFWSSCTTAPCPEIRRHINIQHYICSTYYSPTQIINQWLLPSCCFCSSFTWRSLAAILSCSEFRFCWATASSEAWATETGKKLESGWQVGNSVIHLELGTKSERNTGFTVILHHQFRCHDLHSSHSGLHGCNRRTSFKLS